MVPLDRARLLWQSLFDMLLVVEELLKPSVQLLKLLRVELLELLLQALWQWHSLSSLG